MARTQAGTEVYLSDTFGTALSGTMTNANPCVISFGATVHGIVTSGYVMIKSPWKRLNNQVFYVTPATTTSLTLVGVDTSNTKLFPAANNSGTCQVVTGFIPVESFLGFKSSGGDIKTIKAQYVDQLAEFNVTDGFNAIEIAIEFDADFVGGTFESKVRKWSDEETILAMRVLARNGAFYTQATKITYNPQIIDDSGKVSIVNAKAYPLSVSRNYPVGT